MNPFNVALIIPTGIGASIGGYGGDAMTLLPLFASICDMVITHPNVANAACFQTLPANCLYVEGYGLDRFFAGDWSLHPARSNKIGIIWDSGISKEMEILHQNVIAGVQTVYGVDIAGIEKTDVPVQSALSLGPSGRSTGQVINPDVLLNAASKLIDSGATALAVCCLMPSEEDEAGLLTYQQGGGIDPIGGLEAMISHFLVKTFQLPAAHAPVFSLKEAQPVTDRLVDPRTASEFTVSTFLPCVLTGLARAPRFEARAQKTSSALEVSDVSALIVPADALGSLPVLSALARKITVFAVENNTSVMNASTASLGIMSGVVPCHSYLEALGHIVALKEGITVNPHIIARQ